ncbi:hypothetical protein CVM39_17910 [Pseudooceanicola antarcticus]|uniref:Uncharacterized protein n=1 Tax=Pseudooceanicola antarcticus TaxID=1247613 RepID=A0ABX4MLG6_9RHOB|nr:hypothetical protein CVM39_17910 [Pseudooceanicola antarcticus]
MYRVGSVRRPFSVFSFPHSTNKGTRVTDHRGATVTTRGFESGIQYFIVGSTRHGTFCYFRIALEFWLHSVIQRLFRNTPFK